MLGYLYIYVLNIFRYCFIVTIKINYYFLFKDKYNTRTQNYINTHSKAKHIVYTEWGQIQPNIDLVYSDGLGLPQSSGQSSSKPRDRIPRHTYGATPCNNVVAECDKATGPAWVQIPFSLPRAHILIAQGATSNIQKILPPKECKPNLTLDILHHYCGAFSFCLLW